MSCRVGRFCLLVLLWHAAACDPSFEDDLPDYPIHPNQPPVVSDQYVHTDENTAVTIDGVGLAFDLDGDTLTASAPSAPSAASIQLLANNQILVTPSAGFTGNFDATWTVSDATHHVPTVAHITVFAHDGILATGATIEVQGPTAITLSATGAIGLSSFEIVSQPSHGLLSGVAPYVSYAPTLGYAGDDSFTFRASDSFTGDSSTATILLHVTAATGPFAFDSSASGTVDQPFAVALSATSLGGAPLAYNIVTQPALGSLSGTPPNLTYTPAGGAGFDSFLFSVSDGAHTSNLATVTLTIVNVNDPPTATPQTISTSEDAAASIALTGSDPDHDPLFATVTTGPAHGSLTGSNPVIYQPAANYHGTDSFTFTVSDGSLSSAPATISINVISVEDPPIAAAIVVAATEDTPASIALAASDGDGDALSYAVATQPASGVLSGVAPLLTYTPNANFNGSDSFTYTASSRGVTSAPAVVSIQVAAVNDPPTATDSAVSTPEDTAVAIPLHASDVETAQLTYTIVSLPSDGALTGTGANRTYTPALNATGTRTLQFRVTDAGGATATATVTITITPVNDPPVARDDYASAPPATPITLDVLGNDSDADGDVLSIDAVDDPAHGEAEVVAGHIVYTPDVGFADIDVFTYTIADPTGATATAQIHVGIAAFPPNAPAEALVTVGGSIDATTLRVPAISADGRFIAFDSALPLVADDTNNASDVYVYDRNTRAISRASVASTGSQAHGSSVAPQLSADGRYVVFTSTAADLVPDDTNNASDVFRHDRVTGQTLRISVAGDGHQATGTSSDPHISDDGNTVSFASQATDLVPDDHGFVDVFVRDVAAATTTRISVGLNATGNTDGNSSQHVLSGDGRYVAFASQATNLVQGGTDGTTLLFLRDRTTAATTLISVSTNGVPANAGVALPAFSADGKFVAFMSSATTLVPQVLSAANRIYVRELASNITTRVSPTVYTSGRLSGTGQYLAAFGSSPATIFDRFSGSTVPLPAAFGWVWPVLSANARYVVAYDPSNGGRLVIAPNALLP